MSSRPHLLGASDGREIVFCHNCRHQWYCTGFSDSLTCPECESSFLQVVTSDHDPRVEDDLTEGLDHPFNHENLRRLHAFESRYRHVQSLSRNGAATQQHRPDTHATHSTWSDPEEDDIDDLLGGPARLTGHRLSHRHLPETFFGQGPPRPRHESSGDMFRRFTGLMGDPNGRPIIGHSGPETLFHDDNGSRVTYQTFHGPGFSAGMSSITITAGSANRVPAGEPGSGPQNPDNFMRLLSEMLSGVPPFPQRPGDASPRDFNHDRDRDGADRRADMSDILNHILAAIVNPNIAHGDAVYSQEALDRIITGLMEANPQSNAPPPATQSAIASLPKKKLDEDMLGPEMKGECTICIEEVNAGDEVAVLPCGHWFHEECASLWLTQHNSCPVCRAAIDGPSANKARNETTNSQGASQGGGPSTSSRSLRTPGPSASAESGPTQAPRRETHEYDFLRHLTSAFDNQRDSNARSSHQTSQSSTPPNQNSTNNRERSRDSRGSSSSGPLNWLRDRFSGR